MFGEDTITLSTRHDHRNRETPAPYFLRSHEVHDQQTVAASNAFCSLSQHCQSDSFETEISNSQNDGSFHISRTPSSFGAYENTAWYDKRTWTTSPARDHTSVWAFETQDHVANHQPVFQYPDNPYGGPAISSLPSVDGLPALAPLQQHTPPSDTLTVPLSCPSTPMPSIQTNSCCFSSTRASSVEPEHGEKGRRIPMIEQMDASAESISSAPYAKLIERALLEADGNRLLLKDIYNWIEINTNKASNPSSNGWKNSVRHNLSMNGAFTKIEIRSPENKSQKVYMWMLEPSAKEYGIQSTTRFRRKNDIKSGGRICSANDRRARSGRKGGWAAQKSAKLRKRSEAVTTSRLSQSLEHENSSLFENRRFETPTSALPVLATASWYHPYLPSPPLQQYSSQEIDGYNYTSSYAYVRVPPTTQLASPQTHRFPTLWSALTSTTVNQSTDDCLTSQA